MTINLRVVGVFFQEDIAIAVTPDTTIKDVMDEAQKKFPGFSYTSSASSDTLYTVSNKPAGSPNPLVLRDSDRKIKPPVPGSEFKTWQSYIFRNGLRIGVDGVFTPFGKRKVEDGDEIVWRLLTIVKK
jgi:hypothetical protein